MYPSRISKLRQISYIMQSVKKCVSSERLSTFLTHWPPATCEPKVRMFPYVFSSKKMTFFRRALALKIFSAGGVSKRGALSPPLSRKFGGFQGSTRHSGGLQIMETGPKQPIYLKQYLCVCVCVCVWGGGGVGIGIF